MSLTTPSHKTPADFFLTYYEHRINDAVGAAVVHAQEQTSIVCDTGTSWSSFLPESGYLRLIES